MEILNVTEDIKVLGGQVKTFPEGIGMAFEKLAKMLPDGFSRAYYGISYFNKEGRVIYYAAAEERGAEAEQYNLERYSIEKGKYRVMLLKDWRKNMDAIKDMFHEIMKDSKVSKNSTCVEWYKSDAEMLCMIKMED